MTHKEVSQLGMRELPVASDYEGRAYELTGPTIDRLKQDEAARVVAYIGPYAGSTALQISAYQPADEFFVEQDTEIGFTCFYDDGGPAYANGAQFYPPLGQEKYPVAVQGLVSQLVQLDQKL